MSLASLACFLLPPTASIAQTPAPAPAPPASTDQTPSTSPITPHGTVIFSRELPLDPAAPAAAPAQSSSAQPLATAKPLMPGDDDPLKITNAEREALTFTAYDLDVHLTPASAAISVRAVLKLRNDSAQPLTRLTLQISSSLHWDGFSRVGLAPDSPSAAAPITFAVRLIATDTDHTGFSQEAVVSLQQPLAPGASITLTALYSGAIPPSAERLERIGAPDNQALAADWDAIGNSNPAAPGTPSTQDDPPSNANTVFLRGFGNVLWYPVASAPVFLGDGAKLFQAFGRTKLREEEASVRLRLAVEYTGDPPDAAFFCGHREHLIAHPDDPNLPVADVRGIATAEFEPRPLGFRTPSLFVADHPATEIDPSGKPADVGLIAAVTDHYDALQSYSAAAALVQPLLADWFGAQPLTRLTILDHPGQPFEDDALLVRPVRVEEPSALAPSLAHSLAHAWIRSTHPWIDEGLAEFAGLLWTERSHGRLAALSQMQDENRGLALAEPAEPAPADGDATSAPAPEAQSLLRAADEVYYRTKAASVWWMLRDMIGDATLKRGLQAYRLDPNLDTQANGLEHTLERYSGKDLRWFFDDWVYRDRGLPDLTILSVTPRQLETRAGLPGGWLVAVQVRNDGYAEAQVPVTIRAASGPGANAASQTQQLRIPGRSSASIRIVFAGTPAEVQVNDGGVPETRVSVHKFTLTPPAP